MSAATEDARRSGPSPETVDRLAVGLCAAIWLLLCGLTVTAAVALARLAGGRREGPEPHSSVLLYSIIVVSALVLIAAVPLLIRARRTAQEGGGRTAQEGGGRTAQEGGGRTDVGSVPAVVSGEPVRPPEAPTEKIRIFGVDLDTARPPQPTTPTAGVPAAVLNRLLLRGTSALVGSIGLALIGVAVATYLLASARDTGAWVALGAAGVITVAMPAVLAFFQNRLTDAVDQAALPPVAALPS